jgi:dUTPase
LRLNDWCKIPEVLPDQTGYALKSTKTFTFKSGQYRTIHLGINVQVPHGTIGYIGNVYRNCLSNGFTIDPFTISSTNMDHLAVTLKNIAPFAITIHKGDMIACLTLLKSFTPQIIDYGQYNRHDENHMKLRFNKSPMRLLE